MSTSRRFISSPAAIAAAFTLACTQLVACSTNPATGKSQLNLLSRDQAVALGDEAKGELAAQYGGPVPDPYLQQYVSEIGHRLAAQTEADYPSLPWEFTLLDSDVINAFALPGGKVFVTRGLAARLDSEAQLAGVLGHEVGHVTAEHANQRLTGQLGLSLAVYGASVAAGASEYAWIQELATVAVDVGGQGFLLKFGRDEELEADALGMRYMSNVGYNPRGQLEVMQVLAAASAGPRQPEFLSTHPDPGNRVQYLTEQLNKEYPNADQSTNYVRNEAQFGNAMVDMRTAQPAYDLADEGDAVMAAAFEAHNAGDQAGADAKYREALGLYERAAAMQPRHAILHVNVAQAQFYLNDYAQAEATVRKALDLESDTFWPNFMGGLIAIKAEQNAVAQTRLQNALELVPTSPVGLYYLAVSYDREDDQSNAALNYRKTYHALQGQGDLAEAARTRLIELGEPDPAAQ